MKNYIKNFVVACKTGENTKEAEEELQEYVDAIEESLKYLNEKQDKQEEHIKNLMQVIRDLQQNMNSFSQVLSNVRYR